jgi:hypothetical protein
MSMPRAPQINLTSVPVGAGLGAAAAIVLLLGAMLVELPELRWLAVCGGLGGAIFGLARIAWHRTRGCGGSR